MLGRRVLSGITIVLLAAVLSGCSQRFLDFTLISTKNFDMSVTELGGKRVTGVDKVNVFFVPIGTPSPKEAIDRAIESAGPGYDALIDGVLTYKVAAFIFGTISYVVEGTAIKTSEVRKQLSGIEHPALYGNIVYHSKLGISNDSAIEEIARADG